MSSRFRTSAVVARRVATAFVFLATATSTISHAAKSERARFLLELGGVAVGVVELEVDDARGRYRYRSTHLFAREGDRSERVREVTLPLRPAEQGGLQHESLRLWRALLSGDEGCVRVRSELEGREGELCVRRREGREVHGTLHGDGFHASLGPDGRLSRFSSRGAVLRRVESHEKILSAKRDVFSEGFPVRGQREGPLRWAGAEEGSRQAAAQGSPKSTSLIELARRVHGSFPDKSPSPADFVHDEAATRASCLGHARRFIAWAHREGVTAELVQGVFVEPGTDLARPHAWVRVGTVELDPTLVVEVTPATHLALPHGIEWGEAWLALLSGRLRVER